MNKQMIDNVLSKYSSYEKDAGWLDWLKKKPAQQAQPPKTSYPWSKTPNYTPPDPNRPLDKDDKRILTGPELRGKYKEKAQQTSNPYDMVLTAIGGSAEVSAALKGLEKYPEIYKFVDKYLTSWSKAGDRMSPAGGLSSKEATEEKEAGLFKQDPPAPYLTKIVDDFSKKFDEASIIESLKKYKGLPEAFTNLKAVIDRNRQTIRDPEEAPRDNAVLKFVDALNLLEIRNKVLFNNLSDDLRKDLDNMKKGLGSMMSDTARNKILAENKAKVKGHPKVTSQPPKQPSKVPVSEEPISEEGLKELRKRVQGEEPVAPAQPEIPVQPGVIKQKVTKPVKQEQRVTKPIEQESTISGSSATTEPKPAPRRKSKRVKEAEESNNILIFDNIEMAPSILEVDASTDEISKLEKLLLNNIN